MPNCFSLTPKGGTEPELLNVIDDKMRVALGVPCDDSSFYCDWYAIVGFALAMGRTFEQIRASAADDPEMLRVVDWLDANYTSNAWVEVGRGR